MLKNGFWTNNPGIVQLLGLCPLLAVSGTLINGLGLGLATLFVLMFSNLSVSLIRNIVRPEVRIPVYVLIIAALVTCVELVMNAYLHELFLALGIFIPLIVTNCAIIGRAESFASKNSPLLSMLDGFSMGAGFALVLVVLGAIRELVGYGSLMRNAEMLFGANATNWQIQLFPSEHGFLLAILPPGAFFFLGLLIAMKNLIDKRYPASSSESVPQHVELTPASV
ncbi:MAG: electron transport complex subunit E [Gammaproteobacteria bacterium]|nr:electron transport complex subunit E [Gammaproteobacteria bacterium]